MVEDGILDVVTIERFVVIERVVVDGDFVFFEIFLEVVKKNFLRVVGTEGLIVLARVVVVNFFIVVDGIVVLVRVVVDGNFVVVVVDDNFVVALVKIIGAVVVLA